MWRFAFAVSALSHHPEALDAKDERHLARFPPDLAQFLRGERVRPTVVVQHLLNESVGTIRQVLETKTTAFLDGKLRDVHNGMFFFVDKLDQAVGNLSREAWVNIQAGLLEAGFDLRVLNTHLKVYASIREEAFASYHSRTKVNVFSATSRIEYSRSELHKMLERLTIHYEGLPLNDFVNVETVGRADVRREAAFDFLHRHTLCRPRDLVIISSAISRRRRTIDERIFKDVVRETSAGILVENVFDEMHAFLDALSSPDARERLFSLLPYGILSSGDLPVVWGQFHGVEPGVYELGETEPKYALSNPFRELYDCGLLGVIRTEDEDERQYFRQPNDASALRSRLPRSPFYFLHPALHSLVSRSGSYRVFRDVVVGHDEPWPRHYHFVIELQRRLFNVSRGAHKDVESSVLRLMSDVGRHVELGMAESDAKRCVGATRAFRDVCAQLDRLGWDDVQLFLLEECASA